MRENSFQRVLLIGLLLAGTNAVSGECLPPPVLGAQLRKNPTLPNYEAVASWFGEHKQYSCAAEVYTKALSLAPTSPRITYFLGLNLFFSGQKEAAVDPLKRSTELAPSVVKPHIVLASVLEQLGRSDEASAEWQVALKLDPSSPDALHGVAKNLLKQRKYSQVIGLLRSAPDDDVLIGDIAQSYMGLEMYDESLGTLKAALRRRPFSRVLANSLARMEIQRSQYQEAEKLCAKTVRAHPADLESQILYLQVLLLTGNRPVSGPLGQKLLRLAPHDFTVLLSNGILEHDAGKYEASRAHLQEAISLNPSAAVGHFNLGLTLTQLGQTQEAKRELQKALDLGAKEPEVHLQLAKILHTLGENEAAQEHLKLYQSFLQQQHNYALALSKSAQGDKALQVGSTEKAAGFYREALEAWPHDASLNFKLAVCLDKIGDRTAERGFLNKAIELNPDLAPAENQLGFLASQDGDPATAEKHFREALRAAPAFTEAWVNLAAVLGLQSKFPEAQDAVQNALRLEPKNPQALLLRDTIAKALAQQ